MLTPGTTIELDVEKPAAGGRMIARHGRQVVLVAGAIPGERVMARVERTGRGVTYAAVERVLAPDGDRRDASGDPRCGGSVFAHVRYARQLVLKGEIVADAFARIGRMPLGMPVPVAPSPERGYRLRARLHVDGARLGFFREGTHQLCDARTTGQLLPETSDMLPQLGEALAATGETNVVAVVIAENLPASERAAHVELPEGVLPHPRRLAPLASIAALTGLTCGHAKSGVVTIAGDPLVRDPIASLVPGAAIRTAAVQRHVRAFFQGNRFLLPALVSNVCGLAGRGKILDLYAGVGLFSIALAAAGASRVIAVEGDRASVDDLRANASPFGSAVLVRHAGVEHFLSRRPDAADSVLVDPPRTGMSREALDGLIGLKPPRVVYLSCDVATLARDCRRLADAGYRLEHIEAFDLFPNTAHIETLVALVHHT